MGKDDFKITEHRDTLQLHFMPAILRQNLRNFISDTEKAIENAKGEDEKKHLIALKFFYEDLLTIITWAFTKLDKSPKPPVRNGKKKRQDS